jgi:hypothetical protein
MLINICIFIDLAEFKAEVAAEASQSKEHLAAMVTDFKDALEDGNNKEIKLYLQTLLDEDAILANEEDQEQEVMDCGDCNGCGTGDGCGAPLPLDEEEDELQAAEPQKKTCACGKNESCGCSGSCGKSTTDIFALLDEQDEHKA